MIRKITAAALALVLMACSSGSDSGPSGEYSGTAVGFGGDVTVTLKLDGGKITSADIKGDQETDSVGQAAFAELSDQLVKKGSAEIDGVSGATFTSNAVKEAAAAALSEANK